MLYSYKVSEWKAKCEMIEKKESERRAADEKAHSEEVAFLTHSNKQLKSQLESFLQPAKGA